MSPLVPTVCLQRELSVCREQEGAGEEGEGSLYIYLASGAAKVQFLDNAAAFARGDACPSINMSTELAKKKNLQTSIGSRNHLPTRENSTLRNLLPTPCSLSFTHSPTNLIVLPVTASYVA